MGFEYKIRFTVPAGYLPDRLHERLPDPAISGSAWVEYAYELQSDGFYFVDHGRSNVASVAFRQLVDEALRHAREVVVEEL